MPRFTVCSYAGCPELAPVGNGRCAGHQPRPWANPSKHTLSRPRNWWSIRGRVLRRDRKRCVVCGSVAGLSVDHIVPVSEGGTWEPDNLQTLCMRHHREKTMAERSRRSSNA